MSQPRKEGEVASSLRFSCRGWEWGGSTLLITPRIFIFTPFGVIYPCSPTTALGDTHDPFHLFFSGLGDTHVRKTKSMHSIVYANAIAILQLFFLYSCYKYHKRINRIQ